MNIQFKDLKIGAIFDLTGYVYRKSNNEWAVNINTGVCQRFDTTSNVIKGSIIFVASPNLKFKDLKPGDKFKIKCISDNHHSSDDIYTKVVVHPEIDIKCINAVNPSFILYTIDPNEEVILIEKEDNN